MTLQRTVSPLKRESIHNPFCGKALGHNGEALVRSFHSAVRGAYFKTVSEKPALALFAYSSGYPIRMAFEAVKRQHGFAMPARIMLPLTSHHVHDESRAAFHSDFKGVRKRVFKEATADVADALEHSENPKGPIYLIDEVLSGACVTNIRNRLRVDLLEMGIRNEIKILALASQKKILFNDEFSAAAHELAERDCAYIHPVLYGQKHVRLRPMDVQLTSDGLDILLSAGIASFKAPGFDGLVKYKVATVFPVLDLFTTDNLRYDPLLFLDMQKGVLKATSRSYSHELQESTSALLYDCTQLEGICMDRDLAHNIGKRTMGQKLPKVLGDQF